MANLEEVLKDFDRRLNDIEAQLREMKTPPREALAKQSPLPTVNTTKTPPSPITRPTSVSAQAANNKSPSLDSSSVLAFIGIVFVILAGVFFIKITIESGWLTPLRQILLAAGTGLALFLAPQFFPKAEREYGALLAGAGTTILHLTWLGAYFYHHILDANAALICATLVGVFSIFANFDRGHRGYLLVAMAGTYLSAPLVGYSTGELPVLAIFLVIWNISFSATALMNQRRDVLFIASYYAVFTVLLLSGKAIGYEQQSQLLILQLVQFLIFALAMLAYSVHHKSPLSADENMAVLPLLLLFYLSTGHLLSLVNSDFAPWFGITIGAFVLGIYFVARKFLQDELKSGPTLTTFVALTFVHSFFFQLLHESAQPLVALLIGIAVMFIWSRNEVARKEFLFPLVILLSTFAYGAILTIVSVNSIEAMYLYNGAYGIVALMAVMGMSSLPEVKSEVFKYSSVLLAFGHLEVMLGLYRLSQKVSWSGALFVTITWGIYAGLILAIAYKRKDKTIGNSALIILLAVSLKAFFYDVVNTGNLIRVACLFAEGLLLYLCGWIFRRMQSWEASSLLNNNSKD